ncbi:restriction endonuclease subunit S [uncultured Bartonella sp.]|uniref:restriction endonuclease subunit S n=1 Tax=uncultured Bartonella sp. TaxID=104108 RepID=UPI0025D9EF2F|nr:restriction endonuclease subunit S [uncultured Bartonella sp.]
MSPTIIEKLLKGGEVEWIRLGERLKRTTGTSITAGKMRELHKSYGPLKIFGGGKTYALVNFNDIPEKDINKYPSIIVKSRGIIEFDYYNKPFSHKNELWAYHSEDKDICIKYIYYYMKTKEAYFQHLGNKMQMPQISIQDTDKFPVPLPPLSVQKKIVRILDAFTTHAAELTAELNERKKQYQYYLNKLFTFSDDEVEWKILGEILKRTGGTSITAAKMKELNKANGDLKIFAGGRTFAFVDFDDIPQKDINKHPSIIVKSRGNIEFDYYDKPFSHKKEFWSYHSEDNDICIKYIYYYMKTKEAYFQHLGNKMQMPQISIRDTDMFLVPIPSLSVQKEIVRKLDAFSTLATSISEGLPREIELRNKQYEYYRDQLLNFPKPENNAIKQSPTNL